MECSHIRRRLSAFMDGELDDQTKRLTREHLSGCSECLKLVQELKKVDERIQRLPAIDPRPDFTSRMVSHALQASRAPSREAVPFGLRLRQIAAHFLEAIFDLFEPGSDQSTRTLDEFGDCPPLSMSFVYFKLLGPGDRGC